MSWVIFEANIQYIYIYIFLDFYTMKDSSTGWHSWPEGGIKETSMSGQLPQPLQ